MPRRLFFALTLCLSLFCSFGLAQDCAPPSIVANAKSSNLFSPEQEMILGELTVQNMAGEIRFLRDEQIQAYVDEIGQKLVKHLPPTGLKFQFHVIDLPEANAFNIPGGHVFLSRKLIAFVTNEDELAGVIAHELGHATVRHGAIDISEMLRKVLNINSLGDRKDITEKYNLLIERARTKNISRKRSHEDAQQLEADKIGLYAMVAAGYDPSAFTSFFDRLAETEGKTGGWLSNLFGNARPEQKRLREMIRISEQLPQACREGRSAKATDNFLKWQADVVYFRPGARREELPGLAWKKELAPKLRSDVSHFAFSQDGRFLLAQDDFAITVIDRSGLKVLFQIPAEGARDASFTPDGRFVIFTTNSLRYEKWDVAEKKPVEVRELVVRRDCWEHKLSPDGNYLACVDTSATLKVMDTKTGKKVWEKKEFYQLNWFEYFAWLLTRNDDEPQFGFFRIEFSPDSRFVMFSRTGWFRFSVQFDSYVAAKSENTALALDLIAMRPAQIGGDLKSISARPYIFLDSERVLGRPTDKIDEGGIFSFPSGKRLTKFAFTAREIKRTANPDYIIVKPLKNALMGVFDLKKGIIASGMDKPDGALWNNFMAYEAANGKILIREVRYNDAEKKFDTRDVGTVDIPVSSIKNLSVAEVSDNFGWLLLSSKTRGGLWKLDTGERKFYVRGFKGGIVADDGGSVGDFPKLNDTEHNLVLISPKSNDVTPIGELPEKGARQYGRFLLLRSSLRAEGKEKKDISSFLADDESEGLNLRRSVRFELKDFVQGKTIWTRDFPKEAPEFSFDQFSGRLIFYWRLGSETGKEKLKESPELQAKASALGNKADDYLVEVVDAFAQKTIGTMLLETGQGSFNVGEGLSEADWLVLHDSTGRILVYSIKEGTLRHRFFGSTAALNPKKNQIVVENFPGEVVLYDLNTGDAQTTFVINGSAAFVRFNLEGNKLFVLSDAQSAYAFDLNKLAAKDTAR
ncbi:MAG: M48 family metalloprotease [Pyrinomonadaceae bacterium]|nr:M48 family metalloprotease [Pyrinomonadaceae bacterium]